MVIFQTLDHRIKILGMDLKREVIRPEAFFFEEMNIIEIFCLNDADERPRATVQEIFDAGLGRLPVGYLQSDDLSVEGNRFVDIAHVDGDMVDPFDVDHTIPLY